MSDSSRYSLAVLLPCYNEGLAIASVVIGFRKALPGARIYVYDNNSTDDTAQQAAIAGATVITCRRQGKGNVVRQMFADIEADIYIMADGDGTYDAAAAPRMVEALLSDRSDMVVGTRRNITEDAGRRGHALGNQLFNRIYQAMFGRDFTDIFSGYRVFTRRFAKSFPANSAGFEIETEMSVHASTLRLPVTEIEFDYGRRVEGSASKLSTFRDGARILTMMAMLLKETKPFVFFGAIAAFLFAATSALMLPITIEFFETGLVERIPTVMLAMTLLVGAMLSLSCGIILDSVSRARIEQKRIFYLSQAPARGERAFFGAQPIEEREAPMRGTGF
ncbi:MAG: glycosyltransferase [Acidobacteria bacterium]|jgi:glycosyltransferase involved in cell wall biosynthesis|nr:glycosyltransferase [Acidobacteriota bacterium]